MAGLLRRFASRNYGEEPDGRVLLSSYHCSRYNQNTGRLDATMFESVFERATVLQNLAGAEVSTFSHVPK